MKLVMLAIGEDLKNSLKSFCAKEGKSIREVIEALIEKLIKGEISWK